MLVHSKLPGLCCIKRDGACWDISPARIYQWDQPPPARTAHIPILIPEIRMGCLPSAGRGDTPIARGGGELVGSLSPHVERVRGKPWPGSCGPPPPIMCWAGCIGSRGLIIWLYCPQRLRGTNLCVSVWAPNWPSPCSQAHNYCHDHCLIPDKPKRPKSCLLQSDVRTQIDLNTDSHHGTADLCVRIIINDMWQKWDWIPRDDLPLEALELCLVISTERWDPLGLLVHC